MNNKRRRGREEEEEKEEKIDMEVPMGTSLDSLLIKKEDTSSWDYKQKEK